MLSEGEAQIVRNIYKRIRVREVEKGRCSVKDELRKAMLIEGEANKWQCSVKERLRGEKH